MRSGTKTRRFLFALLGCAILLATWEIAGRYRVLGDTFPALSQVLRVYGNGPKRALLLRSAAATLSSAAIGYAAGACAGTLTAILAHLVPFLRHGLDRMAVLVNALPVIALGPVLIITAGRKDTPAALASVPVFFLLYVSAGLGLRGAGRQLGMMFTTLGASRQKRLWKLEAIASVPSLLDGMKIAAGSAMIGAIVGEWFGAPSGLGVVVLNSMQNFQIPLLWATVLVIAAVTLSAYGLLTLAERAARRRIG
jgi:ABC-type nitrate/sulfonate/bicarbonate transport system permease component